MKTIVISPRCAPFWEERNTDFVVFMEPDRYGALGVAAGLQIVAHETRNRTTADVDFVALASPEVEPEPRTLFLGRRPAAADILGVSLANYSVLPSFFGLMDRCGIPICGRDRRLYEDPFVVAGGLATVNPAPVEPFIDAFVLGEGSLAMPRLVEIYGRAKRQRLPRRRLEEALRAIPGVYLPSAFRFDYDHDRLVRIRPAVKVQFQRLAAVPGTRRASLFTRPHRGMILADYGCKFKCDFCQMSHVRGKYCHEHPEAIKAYLREFDAMGVTSATLSSASVTNLPPAELVEVLDWAKKNLRTCRVVIRSVRPDRLPSIFDALDQQYLHLAPETAAEGLRAAVLNKRLTNRQFWQVVEMAARKGVATLRLFHLVGVPGETETDRRDYAELIARAATRVESVEVNINPLFPQPGTPLQRMGPIGLDTYRRYCRDLDQWLQSLVKTAAGVKIQPVGPLDHLVQGIANTGDRHTAAVLYDGFQRGNTLEDYLAAGTEAGIDGREHFRPGFSGLPPWAMVALGNNGPMKARQNAIAGALRQIGQGEALEKYFPHGV